MRVIVKKHTDIEEAHACIRSTSGRDKILRSNLRDIYEWEHSISRSQIFSIQLVDVFSFVSVHLVRHVTTVPFVTSRRIDRGGTGDEGRFTLVDHRFIANAESILNMAKRRLCYQSSGETRDVMMAIREAVREHDPDLAHFMVSNCVYRGGICPEPKTCGNYRVRRFGGEDDELIMRRKRQ